MDVAALTPAGRLVLAIASVLGPALPTWALLLWIARSSHAWRVAADRAWLRLLAAAWTIFGSLLAPGLMLGTTRAGVTRFDPSAREAVKVALFVWGAQLVLFIVAGLWVVKRRGGGRWNSVTRPAAQLTGPVEPNPAAPYAGWRSRVLVVREEPGSTVIALRPYRIWEAVAFPGGMLVGMLVIAPAVLPESMMQAQRDLGVLILLAICLVSGSVGARSSRVCSAGARKC